METQSTLVASTALVLLKRNNLKGFDSFGNLLISIRYSLLRHGAGILPDAVVCAEAILHGEPVLFAGPRIRKLAW